MYSDRCNDRKEVPSITPDKPSPEEIAGEKWQGEFCGHCGEVVEPGQLKYVKKDDWDQGKWVCEECLEKLEGE